MPHHHDHDDELPNLPKKRSGQHELLEAIQRHVFLTLEKIHLRKLKTLERSG
jgi:hypothetical protein